MEKSIIIVKSITYAMRGQQLLQAQGISAYIERTTGTRYGCGYGIRVRTADAPLAARILLNQGVRVVDTIPAAGGGVG